MSKTTKKASHKFKVGDTVKVPSRKPRGLVVAVDDGTAEVRFTDDTWSMYAVGDLTLISNPLAKKLANIVCHDNPNRTMHLGTTCQLSMTVKEFNDLMQKAAKALNNGRKV